jgi:hypothetical protein
MKHDPARQIISPGSRVEDTESGREEGEKLIILVTVFMELGRRLIALHL